jgi:hypothetical protein
MEVSIMGILKRLFSSSRTGQTRRQPEARLRLEALEDRSVPSVTFHGGPVVPHAQVTNLFLGNDWYQPSNRADIWGLNQFMGTITHSSYMSMLGEYGVGQGSFAGGTLLPGPSASAPGSPPTVVSEGYIQGTLFNLAFTGQIAPTANSVYVIWLPPNVQSALDNTYSFMGHHNSYWVLDPSYNWHNVYYVVMPHPQGNVADNGYNLNGLTDFQKQTVLVSHELSEAVTDPQVWQDSTGAIAYGTGWHDGPSVYSLGNEIGDLANLQVAYLDGYAVQREWSNYFGRGIVPARDTQGAFIYAGSWDAMFSIQTAEGRQGQKSIQPNGLTQYHWQLDDGSSTGWFIVG